MAINSSSQARGTGVGVKNIPRSPSATDLPRKILIVGAYDETTKTSVVEDVAQLATSAAYVGDITGYGFELHRLALAAERGGDGVETWFVPVAENGAGVKATCTLTLTVTTALAGTLYLYIAGDQVRVNVTAGITDANLALAIVAAVTADTSLPVTAAAVAEVVTFTSKQACASALEIIVTTGPALERQNEDIPGGVSMVITSMADGAGVSDYATALANLGEGDAANEDYFTDCVQGNGVDTTTLDVILAYVGIGDQNLGTYKNTAARPMIWYLGDNAASAAGLAALIVISDARLTDRAHGLLPAPGSPVPPNELAAQYCGICARRKQELSSGGFGGQPMNGVIPGIRSERWTVDYDERNTAVAAGLGTTHVVDGVVQVSDSVTFYRPASIPVDSNAYAEISNVGKIQNITNSLKTFFQLNYSSFTVVADVAKVVGAAARANAKDLKTVLADCTAFAVLFEGKAWIYSAESTIELLDKDDRIALRGDGKGFTIKYPVLLSGVGKIIDLEVHVDTKIA